MHTKDLPIGRPLVKVTFPFRIIYRRLTQLKSFVAPAVLLKHEEFRARRGLNRLSVDMNTSRFSGLNADGKRTDSS